MAEIHGRANGSSRTRSPQRGEARWSCPRRQKSARRGGSHTNRSYVRTIKQIWRYPQAERTAGPAPGGFVWIFLTVALSSGPMKSVLGFALPPGRLLFIGRTGAIISPARSFPSTRANSLNQMKDKGFVRSLESGGKRFALLAGSNRRNLVFRERASLVVKVKKSA